MSATATAIRPVLDTGMGLAPTALQTQVITLIDAATEMLGTAQSTLSDLHAHGLDDTVHSSLTAQINAIAQEIEAVRAAVPAMGTAEANDALTMLRDNEQQLANMRDQMAALRAGLTESTTTKTLVWGFIAVLGAAGAGFWLLSRRRERRIARRRKKSRH